MGKPIADTNKMRQKLRSLLNFRDIGGLPVTGNKRIKERVIFRSANPDRISRGDAEKLENLNIRTIIDLRAPVEVKPGRPVDNVEKISLPLDFQQVTRERLKPVIFSKDSEEKISDISNSLYLEILDAVAPHFSQIMDLLYSPERYPLLIHCHAGKDRTGIVIALILLALGAEREIIIEDFMRSNEELVPFFRRYLLMRTLMSFGFFPYRNMLFAVTVRRRNIESVLDRVEKHYGGIEGFLAKGGFDISRLPKMKRDLLTA